MLPGYTHDSHRLLFPHSPTLFQWVIFSSCCQPWCLARWADFPINKLRFWSCDMILWRRPWRRQSSPGINERSLLLWHKNIFMQFSVCFDELYMPLKQVCLTYVLCISQWNRNLDTACPFDFIGHSYSVSASVNALGCCIYLGFMILLFLIRFLFK